VMMEYWNVEVLRLLRIASRDRGMRLIA
jgi:hypothetical protein